MPISGALLVTTPQEVALLGRGQGAGDVPATVGAHRGHRGEHERLHLRALRRITDIFGRGGGESFARRHELEYFGGIPLDVKVRQGGDAGVPAVAQREPGAAALVMRAMSRQVAARDERACCTLGTSADHQLSGIRRAHVTDGWQRTTWARS